MRESRYKKIYPKEYNGYILATILWDIIIVTAITLITKETKINIPSNLEEIMMFCFIGFITLYVIYTTIKMTTTCFFLKYKRIYFEYSSDEVIFNGIFKKKTLKVKDIKSITRNSYRNLLGYTFIKRRKEPSKGSAKQILFAMTWFSDRDIRNMIEFLLTYNRSIVVKGVYPSGHLVRLSHKQRRKNR